MLLSLVLNIIGLTWGLPNYTDRAQDSVALTTLKGLSKGFANGWRSQYPPMHFFVLAAGYAPYLGYLMLSGHMQAPSTQFSYGLVEPLSSLTHLMLIARAVSVMMGVGIVLWVYLAVRELFDRRAALCAGLIVTLYYPLVYYAHNANTDVPYMFWAFLAIYHFVRGLKFGQLKSYILFAVFGTLAISTKDQAFGLLILAPLPVLWARFTEQRQQGVGAWPSTVHVLCDRRLILAVLVAVVTFTLAQNLLFNFSGFVAHVKMVVGPKWQSYATYAPTLHDRLQLLWETTSHLVDGFTRPLFGVCVAGTVYCVLRFPGHALPVLLLAVSYYVLFINQILWTANRHALPIGMILAFFGGKLIADLWQHTRWKTLMRVAICTMFAYTALYPLQLDYLFLRESRYQAEQWMQAHLPQGAVVETFALTHQHLQWVYPRFPAWVKVRYSQAKTPTTWEAVTPDKVRLPNLDFGSEAPDYIIVGEYKSEDIPLQEQAIKTTRDRLIRNLFHGHLAYALVATFKTPTIVPIRSLPVNPTLYMFKRTVKRAVPEHVIWAPPDDGANPYR